MAIQRMEATAQHVAVMGKLRIVIPRLAPVIVKHEGSKGTGVKSVMSRTITLAIPIMVELVTMI